MNFGERAQQLAGLAAAILGWRPHDFWNATPGELATALGIDRQQEGALDAAELARLQALFPDKRDM